MADLKAAMAYTHPWEKGFCNNPDDPGGATLDGYTLGTLQGFGRDYDLDRDGDVDVDDLLKLGPAEKEAIARKRYWRGDGLVSQDVATKVYDIGFNCGVGVGTLVLQRAIIQVQGPVIVADGDFGPKTEAAANAADPVAILAAMCRIQEDRYWSIVDAQARKELAAAVGARLSPLGWTSSEASLIVQAIQDRDLRGVDRLAASIRASKRRPGKGTFLLGWVRRARSTPGHVLTVQEVLQ